MPQLGGASPLLLLFGLFSSIFMFFFKPLLHFVLNIVARRYTGLNADQIRRMDIGSSVTAIRSAVSSFTERPAVSGQPTYATTVLLQSEVCSLIDFEKLRASPSNTLEMDDPCSVFVLPQADQREPEPLARFRAILGRDAVCVDPRFGRAWRVPCDAATALSKANQLGFVIVSSCAGNNNVNTWTLGCVDKKKPADSLAQTRSRSGENRNQGSLSSAAPRNDDRASTPGARSSPETGGDSRTWFWTMLRNLVREIEDNMFQSRSSDNASQIRNRQSPSIGNDANQQQQTREFQATPPVSVRHGLNRDEYSREYPRLGQQ